MAGWPGHELFEGPSEHGLAPRVTVATRGPRSWEGAEPGRNWWHLETYLLPVCTRE